MCLNLKVVEITLVGKKMFVSFSAKIQGDSHSFDTVESEYVNQISLSPTKGEEKGFNSKTTFEIKRVIC
jgi:hypothetical protein